MGSGSLLVAVVRVWGLEKQLLDMFDGLGGRIYVETSGLDWVSGLNVLSQLLRVG